jgi:hypothetical protein
MAAFIESRTNITGASNYAMIREASADMALRRVAADQCVAIPMSLGLITAGIRDVLDGFTGHPKFFPISLNHTEMLSVARTYSVFVVPSIVIMSLTGQAVVYLNDSVLVKQQEIWRTCWGGRRREMREFVKTMVSGGKTREFPVLLGNFTGEEEYVKLGLTMLLEDDTVVDRHIDSLRKLILESNMEWSVRRSLSERIVILEMVKSIKEVELASIQPRPQV